MKAEQLRAAGYDVTDAAWARLAHFVALLLAENQRLNLTAVRTEPEVWRIHVCDSLALLPALQKHAVDQLLDLGSGGGLPGIPLACASQQMLVTLLDATRKKVEALRRIIAALGLTTVQAVWGRAEALAHDAAYRERFDAVVARAVAELPALIEYAAGFVRPGGWCWFFKSEPAIEVELSAAEAAAGRCRLSLADTLRYRLPGEKGDRLLLGYRKQGALAADLPRGPGQARKKPL